MNDKDDDDPPIYLFVRDEMFYPLLLRDDDDARRNAECNPGTLRVEHISGRIVWQKPLH